MIQRQFVSIFTMSHTEFGREQHHLKRSEFVFQRAIGSFHFFHHTGLHPFKQKLFVIFQNQKAITYWQHRLLILVLQLEIQQIETTSQKSIFFFPKISFFEMRNSIIKFLTKALNILFRVRIPSRCFENETVPFDMLCRKY